MKALVTGALGFVGQYLVSYLKTKGDVVSEFENVDIRNQNQVAEALFNFNPEVVYHLAGISFPPDAERDFQQVLAVNVAGTENICRAICALAKKPKLIYISSGEVYGRSVEEQLPVTENTPLKPNNLYSVTKVMAEEIVGYYSEKFALNTVIFRSFNHTGAGQLDSFVLSSFARQMAQIKTGKIKPILKVGNLEVKRDFSDVRDIVSAYRLGAEKGVGVYNLGAGRSYRLRELLDNLCVISGLNPEIVTDPDRLRRKEVFEVYSSCVKAESELGWKRQYQLSQTLKDLYEYWLNKEAND